MVLEVLATTRTRKRKKRNPNLKEKIKLSLFEDDTILYIEKSKDPPKHY